VFRTGGDEFAVILQRDDYDNREALITLFDTSSAEVNASAMNSWEQVHISRGFAIFDPQTDHYVSDTVRRADTEMYANKRQRKGLRR
jgi:GGDEF domain-containing protein